MASRTKPLMTANQQKLAALLKVDRTTIHRWQAERMPYREPAARGLEAEYVVPVCVHWYMGREALREREDLPTDPLFRVLFSYSFGWAIEGYQAWLRRALTLAAAGGFSRDDVLLTIGRLQGAGLWERMARP